jgi:hypothetical protein
LISIDKAPFSRVDNAAAARGLSPIPLMPDWRRKSVLRQTTLIAPAFAIILATFSGLHAACVLCS